MVPATGFHRNFTAGTHLLIRTGRWNGPMNSIEITQKSTARVNALGTTRRDADPAHRRRRARNRDVEAHADREAPTLRHARTAPQHLAALRRLSRGARGD